MNSKAQFDSLPLYHQTLYEGKLACLTSILEMPKEHKLPHRFALIESLLDQPFSLALSQRLHLIEQGDTGSDPHPSRPQLLLHLWCLLGCTDSLEYIAGHLGLTVEEVRELYRELHRTFSIDSLISKIREYYKQNKHLHEEAELRKQYELFGMESSLEPRDTAEDRKQRLRRKYGYFDINLDCNCSRDLG